MFVKLLLGVILIIAIIGAVVIMKDEIRSFIEPLGQQIFRDMPFGIPSFERGGRVVGRSSEGVNPPTLIDRLANRHIVTPTQEVVMTGDSEGNSECLGGTETEVMVKVNNDINVDQLDISYAFENLSQGETQSRITKVASCGRDSMIKQCIPVAPEGSGVRLYTLSYQNTTKEKRVYPKLLDLKEYQESHTPPLLASEFIPIL